MADAAAQGKFGDNEELRNALGNHLQQVQQIGNSQPEMQMKHGVQNLAPESNKPVQAPNV